MTQQEWIEKLTVEGFAGVRVIEFEPNMDLGQHTHEKQSVHIILKGEVTMTDETGSNTVIEGDRVDIEAGTTHSVKIGNEGCAMIMGEKSS